ncbi:MAG TPA: FecR domain-containing protein, partial [Pedobacter sp.]
MMQREDIRELLKKYNRDECSAEEKAFIEDWYLQFGQKDLEDLSQNERTADLHQIWNALPVHQRQTRSVRLWIKTAAAVLLILSAGGYFLSHQRSHNYGETAGIKPGSNKAVLTLANGRQIALNNSNAGKLTYQDSSVIKKNSRGELVYNLSQAQETSSPSGINKIETPPGGQYEVILSDGTKVWLNASSSLSFPTAFTSNQRRVTLSGEG